jgi:hypothetical protein
MGFKPNYHSINNIQLSLFNLLILHKFKILGTQFKDVDENYCKKSKLKMILPNRNENIYLYHN